MRLQLKNLEHLIKHLLEAMEFEQVRVSSNQRDGGIDVEASVCEGRGVCSTSAESWCSANDIATRSVESPLRDYSSQRRLLQKVFMRSVAGSVLI